MLELFEIIQAVLYHIANLSSLYLAYFYFESAYGIMDFFHSIGIYI